MSRRVLAILLVVSMLFNFAVLIGFVKSRRDAASATSTRDLTPATAPAEQSLLARLANELKLDPTQADALKELRRRQQQQQVVFGESLMVVRQDLQAELREDEPDLERVRTLVDQEADLLRQRRQAEAELYGEFVALLSPQQRHRLGERLGPQQQARSRVPISPELVKRFDRNNNGRLDPEEAKQARTDLEGRRREVAPRVQQLPPLWPWFDADDDGELNATEREEMDAFLKDHHPPKALPPRDQATGGRTDRRERGAPDGRGTRGNPRPAVPETQPRE
jgi:Spy/CpxP family protein refolding chaperone